jgi:single-strand DNA-binding protein
MSHTVTAKLNQAARQHPNQNGVTFFVSLGEKNYNFQTKQNEWTNYDAALFAKDGQIQFYTESLVEGAIVEVSGTGIILDTSNPEYKPKLVIQDAKLGFVNSPQGQQAPAQQGGYSQQAPQQQGGFANQGQQQGGYSQQAPQQATYKSGDGFAQQKPAF